MTPDEIMARVEFEPNSGCWLWPGSSRRDGYGTIMVNKQVRYAHRVSYEAHFGLIDSDQLVLHSCDTPRCLNPDHLSLGTHDDNMRDMSARGRVGSARTPYRRLSERESLFIARTMNQPVRRVARLLSREPATIRRHRQALAPATGGGDA